MERRPRPSSENGSNSYQSLRIPALAVAAVVLPVAIAPATMLLLLLPKSMALESLQPVTATTTAKVQARLVTGKGKEECWKKMALEVHM